MKKMRTSGFTLIELIIVIVILGILSVTALPKFVDLSSDARSANLAGLLAALKAGSNLVYLQAVLDDVEDEASSTVMINGAEVDIVFGYPQSSNLNTVFDEDFSAWLDITAVRYGQSNGTTDWLLTDDLDSDGISLGTNNGGEGVGFVLDSYQDETTDSSNLSNCGVSYSQPTSSGEAPEINIFDSGC